MGQSATSRGRRFFLLLLMAVVLPAASCDRSTPGGPPATRGSVRIASLVPAATDLLLAMNAGDRLVAVSNYDRRDDTARLPRVGDYQNVDWEKLASLKPTVMVIQMQPDRMPPSLKARADSLGIALINVQIERIDDVFAVAHQLGEAMGESAAADRLVAGVKSRLDEVKKRVAGKARPRVIICVDSSGTFVAGHDTFLTDLLEIAGGQNVAPKESGRYPSIDREMLMSLKPEVILQLLPDATPQVREQAKAIWPALSELPAVREGRVHQVTEWFVHQPGGRIGDTAAVFADLLHPVP